MVSPLTFNPYKHHLGFLREKIKLWKTQEWEDAEQDIRLIGNNLIDLYYGRLTITEIADEVLSFAEKNALTSPEKLAHWLYPLEYRKIKFTDDSFWVIKQGTDANRFLHIHPGKYSPFTIRVKATNLKTVVAVKILIGEDPFPDLMAVNKIRVEKLNMSPVKGLEKGRGIARLLGQFTTL